VPWLRRLVAGLPPAEARLRSRLSPRRICGGQSGTGTGFPPSTSAFPCHFHSTDAPQSSSSTRYLPQGQTCEAWEPCKQMLFRKSDSIGYKSTFIFFNWETLVIQYLSDHYPTHTTYAYIIISMPVQFPTRPHAVTEMHSAIADNCLLLIIKLGRYNNNNNNHNRRKLNYLPL
jgi:hypothetical protein